MIESGPIPVREGELVAGKYRVERVIGAGGMGVVVSARHEQLDQRVAIKFVRSTALGNEEGVQRFVREARAAVKLRSVHAARVLDVGTLESGVPYMVMELLEGSDLAQVLAERGPLPVEVVAEWMAQVCEALAEAHAAGIVHRDLKPQNLFLARTVGGAAHVKVLDFGVAKSIETMANGPGALTRTSAMLGSPLYMAPEQMRSSRNVDARVDVWALGVVMFELLTQRFPFEAETLPELCLKVVGDRPQALAELRPDIPETMVRVVVRCLEKDRGERFANAAELATALEPLVPMGSRLLVERARLAMRSVVPAPLPGVDGASTRDRTPPSSKPPGAPAATPSGWDSASGNDAAVVRKGSRAPARWLGGGVLAAAAIGGLAFLLRARPEGASEKTAVSSTGPAAAPAAMPSMAELVPLRVVPLEPSGNDRVAAEAGASATATSPVAPRAVMISSPPVSWPAGVGAAATAHVAPPVKAPARDDDIPALR